MKDALPSPYSATQPRKSGGVSSRTGGSFCLPRFATDCRYYLAVPGLCARIVALLAQSPSPGVLHSILGILTAW